MRLKNLSSREGAYMAGAGMLLNMYKRSVAPAQSLDFGPARRRVPPRARFLPPFTAEFRGLTIGNITDWKALLNSRVGPALQGLIADSFAKQRVAGSSQLKQNQPEYTAWKIRKNFDHRRGHKTNLLQSMLRPHASKLFRVTGPSANGVARVVFYEAALHAIVPYSVYYEEMKVQAAGILQLTAAWVNLVFQTIVLPHWGAIATAQPLMARKAPALIATRSSAKTFERLGIPSKLNKMALQSKLNEAEAMLRKYGG